jgi:hypothetical protein
MVVSLPFASPGLYGRLIGKPGALGPLAMPSIL